ncbi:hypothetical protein DID77_02625 [Candidatus Marinamargulisbacteria bacterium SCGC AG-439-L15]|nr:hypothetical protein DID77_02625 [Candidatus Marinamargulisbacteria bacterium SCGC AG-439-L15]
MSDTIKIALIGFGNVGQGVYDILSRNQEAITSRIGDKLEIKTILVRDTQKYQSVFHGDSQLTESIDTILQDPEIEIVVEAIGGEMPAYDYIKSALKAKKYVVTANKEVIAKHKKEFFKCAQENGVDIYFEASVGGGMPIIRALKVGYSANLIQSIYGILNGTTNFILTKIEEDGLEFEDALKLAQDLGFAESDPTMDISGLDAAYKLVILAAVGFKVDIQLESVTYEGIEKIQLQDVHYAKENPFNRTIPPVPWVTTRAIASRVKRAVF